MWNLGKTLLYLVSNIRKNRFFFNFKYKKISTNFILFNVIIFKISFI